VIKTKSESVEIKPKSEGVEVWDIEEHTTLTKMRNVVRKKLSLALKHEPVTCNYVKIAIDIEKKL